MEGEREGGREGGREGRKEGGRKGRSGREGVCLPSNPHLVSSNWVEGTMYICIHCLQLLHILCQTNNTHSYLALWNAKNAKNEVVLVYPIKTSEVSNNCIHIRGHTCTHICQHASSSCIIHDSTSPVIHVQAPEVGPLDMY